MRNLVLGTPQQTATPKPATEPRPSHKQEAPRNVFVVDNLKDYKTIVGDERHKIVAVRFYATWCRACKAMAPQYYGLANKYQQDTIFVDVPVTDKTAALHQGLGVSTLPFSHIYHPQAGLVEELKLTRQDVSAFEQKLQSYLNGYAEVTYDSEGMVQSA